MLLRPTYRFSAEGEGSSRLASAVSDVKNGNDYKRLPILRIENDGRREQIRIYVSFYTLLSTSVLGTDTHKKQQKLLPFIGLREPSCVMLIVSGD